MPCFVIAGYVWHVLGGGPFWPLPIRDQPRKSPSWIGLNTKMPKWETMTVPITQTQRESCGYLILDQKLGKQRHYFHIWQELTKHPVSKQTEVGLLMHGRYIGKSKKKCIDTWIEHQQDSIKGNCESSGATEHTKECHWQFNWIHPRAIVVMPSLYKRKVRETLR